MHAIVRRLRPVRLDALGLAEAVRETVATWQARNPGTEYCVRIEGDLGDVGEAPSVAIYRLVQEGLTNIVRHARATRATVALCREDDVLRLSIFDNGHGGVSSVPASGYGLAGMRERIETLGGTLVVDGKPGAGTRIRAEIPVLPRAISEAPV
jgi:signal transduction histidine kinase